MKKQAKRRARRLGPYVGYGYTADGFDCAIQVRFESYNICSFGCLYCFTTQLLRDARRREGFRLGAANLRALEEILSGNSGISERAASSSSTARKGVKDGDRLRRTLGRTVHDFRKVMHDYITEPDPLGRRRVVQFGGLGEPFCNFEKKHGVSLRMLKLFTKYNQPVRVSTKGGDLLLKDNRYIDALAAGNFWVAFSIISVDDELLKRVDKHTPTASSRLAAMKALSAEGVKTSLRFRPIIPGLSDSTAKHPKAWRELLRRAADAGCRAVSIETLFAPGSMTAWQNRAWQELEDVIQFGLRGFYGQHGAHGACIRLGRPFVEELTLKIRDECRALGMTFACSDPLFKELNDYGCCCGISPDDKVFGNWEARQLTNALIVAKTGERRGMVYFEDVCPSYADKVKLWDMVALTGVKNLYKSRYHTWRDRLHGRYNDLKSNRGPLQYLQGILKPVSRDKNGDIVYQYDSAAADARTGYKSPVWKL